MKFKNLALAAAIAAAVPAFAPVFAQSNAGSFADNPIVYFVVTDRFLDGDPSNNESYGRKREPKPADDVGTFHGGDLAGLKRKLDEGWFRQLGVNAIWITAPYEQAHGWVVGGSKAFKHYAYHGYFALDYTRLDKNMGTEDELRAFVDAAHAQGIRVLFDVVMNHPGYGDLQTLSEYVNQPRTDKKAGMLWSGWEQATLANYHSFIDYNDAAWTQWWGPDWIRAGLRGYQEGGRDDLTSQLAYLPDFKTEQQKPVGLPPMLKNKPDTRAKELPNATVRDYLVTWLTQWVRSFGIDGFRADTVKHVEGDSWRALKKAGTEALAAWKAENPKRKIDDAAFWMTGEDWGHGPSRSKNFDAGFDNMINFDFQTRADLVLGSSKLDVASLDKLYADYAKLLAAPASYNVLSYLSSHDTALYERARAVDAGTVLLLAPGGVQIFYGDETARPLGPMPAGDKQQSTRSDMNWSSVDAAALEHWRTLGQFRARHVALARGAHAKVGDAPYAFSRIAGDDKVVVAVNAAGAAKIKVGGVFAEGSSVRDAYTGATAKVAGGEVAITPHARGVVLLEAAP
ncbi:alpha-amylase family glycosyl hydrolase [Caldimonas sp. KR1-144]|uniref:alpha-amylase family glycosyl hydrolase n=1 Tax=Caldimonas sp. KR1-144 TaxID=3400911 RepID=UPI003BFB551E